MGGRNSGPHRSERLHEDRSTRYDVREFQQQAKAERWPDGTRRTLSYRALHTGKIISVTVRLAFTAGRFGGRRVWFVCPGCARRVRLLFGGSPHVSKPYGIACSKCQKIAYASNLEGHVRRWHRQMDK